MPKKKNLNLETSFVHVVWSCLDFNSNFRVDECYLEVNEIGWEKFKITKSEQVSDVHVKKTPLSHPIKEFDNIWRLLLTIQKVVRWMTTKPEKLNF